uniref:Class III signal peptide-containing protein n=1 Tax=Candidatus Methanomethylicus mesodigestus TaxID=1867258 RepID=A0A7C3F577_9CREN
MMRRGTGQIDLLLAFVLLLGLVICNVITLEYIEAEGDRTNQLIEEYRSVISNNSYITDNATGNMYPAGGVHGDP